MPAPHTAARKGQTSLLLLRVAAILVAGYLLLCGGFYWAMTRPPDSFGRVMARVPSPWISSTVSLVVNDSCGASGGRW